MSDTVFRGGVRELIFPRSLTVIGASERTGDRVINNLKHSGVPAWGVNPKRQEVFGLRCHPSVAALPVTPELAFLLVGHARVEEAFEEAAAAGVRAFVLPGLGNEAGVEGLAVAARLKVRAAELGAAIIGPNCMGVAVPGGPSCWLGTIPHTFIAGHVAALVQSGSIGEALLALGPRVGFRCVISSGGEIARDVADLCAFLAADEGTRAVALFLETVRRPAAFARALEVLAEAGKPVICLKVGRSQAAAQAVVAHSGAVVGSGGAFSALLRRHGVIEVEDYPDMVETMEVMGRRCWPRGARVGAISNSGGEAALLADQAEAAGLPFAPLSADLRDRLQAAFPNYLAPGNPVDAWAVDDVGRVFPRTLELMAASGDFDILLAQVDQSQYLGAGERANAVLIAGALADAVRGRGIFAAVTSVQSSDPSPEVISLAAEHDLALLRSPGPAMRALASAVHWRPPPRREAAQPGPRVEVDDLLGDEGGPLSEHDSCQVLERYGMTFAERRLAHSPAEAAAAAAEIGFPVVVKRHGPAHKSREGGVALGLTSAAQVGEAADRIGVPVLVARQAAPGPEVIAGFHRDPLYGAVLTVGLGGVAVEALRLAALELAPVDIVDARDMVLRAPGLAVAASARAREEVARAVAALSRLASDHPQVLAAEINPLILGVEGALAVDALIVRGDP